MPMINKAVEGGAYLPSKEEIEQATAAIRKKKGLGEAHRAGTAWDKGDVAWVVTPGSVTGYLGTLAGEPFDCADGRRRVMVSAADGDWEVDVEHLQLEQPAGGAEALLDLSSVKEVKKAKGGRKAKGGEKPAKKAESKAKSQSAEDKVLQDVQPAKKGNKSTRKTEVVENAELCHCGCGGELKPKRSFCQGHDARFHGRVKKLQAGILKLKDLEDVQPYAVAFYKAAVKE